MTGAFSIKGEKRHKFVKFKVGEEWPPKFTKLELQMSNGTSLALTDPRRLSRVRLRTVPEDEAPISLLGPDPLTDPIILEKFATTLVKATASVKTVLLAQDRVVSGVGNWIADEVCFQACVHPGAPCNTLSPEQVAALHARLLAICREASDLRADYTVFPKHWLFHHRWGKGKASGGTPRVSSGHPIQFDVIGGRTTAFVPAIQRKGLLSPGVTKASRASSKTVGAGKKRTRCAKSEEGAESSTPQGQDDALKNDAKPCRGKSKPQRSARTARSGRTMGIKEDDDAEDLPIKYEEAEVDETLHARIKSEQDITRRPQKNTVVADTKKHVGKRNSITAASNTGKRKRGSPRAKDSPHEPASTDVEEPGKDGTCLPPDLEVAPISRVKRVTDNKRVGTRRSPRLSPQ